MEHLFCEVFYVVGMCVVRDCVFARSLKGFGMWMFCSGWYLSCTYLLHGMWL